MCSRLSADTALHVTNSDANSLFAIVFIQQLLPLLQLGVLY
jgi:hypothetical protein